jgi:hypothetical protein
MVSSRLLRRVALVGTDVSEEPGDLVFLRSVRRLLVAACVVSSSPIFVTLMKKAPGSSETSVPTRATRRNTQKTPFFGAYDVGATNCLKLSFCVVSIVLVLGANTHVTSQMLQSVVYEYYRGAHQKKKKLYFVQLI